MKAFLVLLGLLLAGPLAGARDIVVSVDGNDSSDGSAQHPLKTISAAAQLAQPGDVVTVRAGIRSLTFQISVHAPLACG